LVVSFLALFVALSGLAWAAQIAQDSVKSRHVKDGQIKNQDLADAAVTTVKLADGSVTTAKVTDESLVGDDLVDETVTGSKIADGTVTGSKVGEGTITGANLADGTITGAKVQNDSISGLDIDEASLSGVALASGTNCCSLRRETLALGTAYSPSDPSTFVSLEAFELRTSTTAGDDDVIQVCKLPSSPFSVPGIVYAGGTRFVPSFASSSNSCQAFDINGAATSGTGDFELVLPVSAHVWGKQFFSGDGAQVIVLDH
jgi:hypothetical protein